MYPGTKIRFQQEAPFKGWYIEGELGSGMFGTVYSIYRNTPEGMRVYAAMKVLSVPRKGTDISELTVNGMQPVQIREYFKPRLDRMMNEIEIMKKFRGNDHIVIYEDSKVEEKEDGCGWDIYIRMEQLENLKNKFDRTNAVCEDVIRLWADIAEGLRVVHKKGIVHLDIKPDNILVSKEGLYKLSDFGIARNISGTNVKLSRAGTYRYMAPEVNNYSGEQCYYDTRADIYSLGLVIYQLLNRDYGPFMDVSKNSFSNTEISEANKRRFMGDVIPKLEHLPKQLWSILEKSLEADPSKRYKNVEELLDDLYALRLSQKLLKTPIKILGIKKEKKKIRPIYIVFAITAIYILLFILWKLLF